jgi:hypothetical protein
MEANVYTKALDAELRKENQVKSICAVAGLARNNYYTNISSGKMTLDRFVKLLEMKNYTLAQFAADVEGKNLIDENNLELTYKIENLTLKVSYLEKLLAACEQGKKDINTP